MSKPGIKAGGLCLSSLVLLAVAPGAGDARQCPDAPPPFPKMVTICHVPPGNPARAHTITVAEPAVRAHLAHGDHLGECPSGCTRNPSLCDDGNACTSDRCDADGQCSHEPVNCDDGNVCTSDLCDPAAGCVSVANDGASCDDSNACTSGDVCAGTVCKGSAVPGCCAANADCDDGDACSIDTCVAGQCASKPRDCAVADRCLAGFCDAATGACATAPVSCSDGNVCTDDSCDPAIGCVSLPTASPPQAKETSCNDGADNDCDGLIDAADPDCAPPPDPGPD